MYSQEFRGGEKEQAGTQKELAPTEWMEACVSTCSSGS
jgi:hypothetical protein